MKFAIRVPATSANLGPGFDALGMAFDLRDDIEVEFSPVLAGEKPKTLVAIQGEGAESVATDDSNLVVQAIRQTIKQPWRFAQPETPQPNISLTCNNRIPHGRGLGSSAAAVVSGVLAGAAYLLGSDGINIQAVYEIATEIEGHPDNAAPAIFGGATVAWLGEVGSQGQVFHLKSANLPISEDIAATLLVPSASLSTKAARAALPEKVPHHDAAFNSGRAALLVATLANQPELLFDATADRLHQNYRAAQMPQSARVIKALRDQGFAAVVSGAGPTVLVLSKKTEIPALQRVLNEIEIADWQVISPELDKTGATVRRIS